MYKYERDNNYIEIVNCGWFKEKKLLTINNLDLANIELLISDFFDFNKYMGYINKDDIDNAFLNGYCYAILDIYEFINRYFYEIPIKKKTIEKYICDHDISLNKGKLL